MPSQLGSARGLSISPVSAWRPAPWQSGSGMNCTREVCPSSASMRGTPTPLSRCGPTRPTATMRPGWRRSCAQAGSGRSRSRPAPATKSARCSQRVTPWCRSGSSWRLRSGGFCAPSACWQAKAVGGFSRRADELVAGELEASPPMRQLVQTLLQARAAILDQIKGLDRQLTAVAKLHPVARLLMTAPGVGAITALSVASAFDQAERLPRSSRAGAYLGLTPRRVESGEVSHNGRISKHGSALTRKHLDEAATTLLTRTTRVSRLKAWGLRLAKASGFKKARVAVARKPAVVLHAMGTPQTPFRWGE